MKGIFTSEWVGLKYFKEFVNDFNFWKLIKNTVGISVLKMIFTFPLPIVFAIMLNEMGSYHFKKLVQTLQLSASLRILGYYLRHFLPVLIFHRNCQQLFIFYWIYQRSYSLLKQPQAVLGTGGISGCVERNGLVDHCVPGSDFRCQPRICLRQLPLTEQAVFGESGASLCHASSQPS